MDTESIAAVLLIFAVLQSILLTLLLLLQCEVNELRRELRGHGHLLVWTPTADAPPMAQPVDEPADDPDFWKHGRPNPLDQE